ncbi:MAG TPA: collagen-like protein [Gaiellaceae bacterium]|nr:collagen-like protein [Gaiellaceae bacterium]
MKKGIAAIAALFGVLAITSGAFAAQHYLITSSSQIKDGAVRLADLAPGARKALHGHNGAKGDRGPAGPKGDTGSQGPQGPAGKPATTLQRLAGDFSATNASVATSLDGVQFGPYSNGGAWGGSVRYDGANGLKLDQIKQLSYNVMYSAADEAKIGAPYLRIFLNDGDHDVVFDATQCATTSPDKNAFHNFEVVGKDVRYDDDSCDRVAPDQQRWSDVVADHGSEVISGIYVTTGFSGGSDLTAVLRGLSVNGHQFTFGSA